MDKVVVYYHKDLDTYVKKQEKALSSRKIRMGRLSGLKSCMLVRRSALTDPCQ